jgi:hypothetical protein
MGRTAIAARPDLDVVMMLLFTWWSALFLGIALIVVALRLVKSGPLWRRAAGVLLGTVGVALSMLVVWVRLVLKRAG